MKKIRLFEMFAGFGGASFALKKAGIPFECVGYSEIDRGAIKIFELNHPNIKNYGDCTKIDTKELPDFDLLTGGFPCQPFSINTKKGVRGDNHKSYNLFKDIIRIVRDKKPEYILLENVRGILSEGSKEVYNTLLDDLKNLKYDVKVFEANSLDYGIPQNRKRVYFICKYGGWNKYHEPLKENLKLSVKDILEMNVIRREPLIKKYTLNKKINIDKYGTISRFEAIMKNPSTKRNSNIAYEILDAPSDTVSRQCDRIYHPTYAPCLTATQKDYLFEVDDKIIVLTPKECFRLMGFLEDEINLEGIPESKQHFLAGNGWDINLISKIFRQMFLPTNPTMSIQSNLSYYTLSREQKEKKLIDILNTKLSQEELWICRLIIHDMIK